MNPVPHLIVNKLSSLWKIIWHFRIEILLILLILPAVKDSYDSWLLYYARRHAGFSVCLNSTSVFMMANFLVVGSPMAVMAMGIP